MIIISNKEELDKYYNTKRKNAYVVNDNVEFTFDVDVEDDIIAFDINAQNIKARNIIGRDISAGNITGKFIKANNVVGADIFVDEITVDNINAKNIKTKIIKTSSIVVLDISANRIYVDNVYANNILYSEICMVSDSISCISIKGDNICSLAIRYSLQGKLSIRKDPRGNIIKKAVSKVKTLRGKEKW